MSGGIGICHKFIRRNYNNNSIADFWNGIKCNKTFYSIKGYRFSAAFAGGAIGKQKWMGTYGRAIGGALLTSAGKRDEEKLKLARENTQFYTPEMRANLLTSRVTATAAERKAVAMGIAKDKAYKNADISNVDPEIRQKAEMFKLAAATLGKIPPGRDKDVDDLTKELGDARPDLKSELTNGKKTFDATATAAEMDREKFGKINWDAIPEAIRDSIFSKLNAETFADLRMRGSGKTKAYMDHALMPPGIWRN